MKKLLNHEGKAATVEIKTGYETTTAKTWDQLTESEKQSIASDWIKDHVYCNVNQVMELLAQNDDHCDYDEYYSIAESADYEYASTEHIKDLDFDELIDLVDEYDLTIGKIEDLKKKEQSDLSVLIIDNIDLDEYGQDNSLDPEYDQAYEFWSVSDHFVSVLWGTESCSKDILGLSVWARYCTGQSICLDSVIQKAAFKVLSDCSYKYY